MNRQLFIKELMVWKTTVSILHLERKIYSIGSAPYRTYICKISNGNFLTYGFGKGNKKKSLLGAIYEALEHYTSVPSLVNFPTTICSYQEINKSLLIKNKIPLELLSNTTFQKKNLAWIKLKNVSNDSEVFIPAVSITPTYLSHRYPDDTFPYEKIYLSSTSTGIAIGSTFKEALQTALLEVIERDSLSLFIIKTFLSSKESEIILIQLTSLSEKIYKLVSYIENCFCSNLKIIFIPNEFEVYTFCAIAYSSNYNLPIKGLGCSFDVEYAIQKALLELIEQCNIYNDFLKNKNEDVFNFLKQYPKFLECVTFNIQTSNTREYKFSDLNHRITYNVNSIEKLIDKTYAFGQSIYFSTLFERNDTFTVKVILSEAEEFFSIIKGVISPIGKRGKFFL
ncbi:MAG: hypothetical protein EXR81_06835 [Gammaproteobacteria bacterium]|nr:hypothetical protein [Gammaproteobacteria bacterium]